jgi:hypothetical protein
LDSKQQQITKYTTATFAPSISLFKYCEKMQRKELVRMVAVEHIVFHLAKDFFFLINIVKIF